MLDVGGIFLQQQSMRRNTIERACVLSRVMKVTKVVRECVESKMK